MRIKVHRSNEKIDIRSLLAAVVICFHYICGILSFSNVSVVVIGMILAVSLYQLAKQKMVITKEFLFIVFYIIICYVFSFLRIEKIDNTLSYFERFLLFGILSLLIGFQSIKHDTVIKYVLVIGLVGTPIVLTRSIVNMNSSNMMGLSYACLPVLLASFIGLSFNANYKIISIINILILLVKFTSIAPRGVWVIIFSMLALIAYYKLCYGKNHNIRFFISIVVLALLFFAGIYLLSNLEIVVSYISKILYERFNVSIYAFDKYLRYLTQNKVLNGRDELWETAVTLIKRNPIFGYGIGYFESIKGIYSHNVISQTLCEAGVFFFIPVAFVGLRIVSKILLYPFHNSKERYHWLIFVFCCGFEILFFSSVYWMYIPFWFFFGTCVKKGNIGVLSDEVPNT